MRCKVIASMNTVASPLCVWVFSNRTVKGVVVTSVSTDMDVQPWILPTFGFSKMDCPLTVTVSAGSFCCECILRLNEKDTPRVKGRPLVASAGLSTVCSMNLPPR